MSTAAIILSHYQERSGNLMKILDHLERGSKQPDKIIFFIDNPYIHFLEGINLPNVSIIRTEESYPVMSRYALGLMADTDYCLFMDDDLAVGVKTLENFQEYANKYQNVLLGLEGNVLSPSLNPYTQGTSINRGKDLVIADIIIRSYFVPKIALINFFSSWWRNSNRLPKTSIDDIVLCLANDKKFIIPVDKDSDVVELNQGRIGQQFSPQHYANRDKACLILRNLNT